MIDVSDLIGKPWSWGARGPDAYDCFGLLIEVSRRYGIDWKPNDMLRDVPYSLDGMKAAIDALLPGSNWVEVDTARPGDAVMCGASRLLYHVCPVVDGGVLHTSRTATGIILTRAENLSFFGYRQQQAYRWLVS